MGGSSLRVGVVGCGYWGAKHLRVVHGLGEASEIAVIDTNAVTRSRMAAAFPSARTFADLATALPYVDAVIIATPADRHADLAMQAIRHGKHVLVEKPMAMSVTEARQLVNAAREMQTTLMIGHTFLFNPAVEALKSFVDDRTLGSIHYIYSSRLNLGLYRRDVNVVWDLAPHDITIMNYILQSKPTSVEAWGGSLTCADSEDVAHVRVNYGDVGIAGYIHVSWLDPRKVRTVTVVGSAKMAIYDDLADEPLRLYDRGVERAPVDSPERPFSYRYGNIVSPYVHAAEPLAVEDSHFLQCIRTGSRPRSDGEQGLATVAVLQAIDRAIRHGGVIPVDYEQDASAPTTAGFRTALVAS